MSVHTFRKADRMPAMLKLAELLAKLHGDGLVHRDLRPESLRWMPQHGEWLLGNFGFSAKAGALPRRAADAFRCRQRSSKGTGEKKCNDCVSIQLRAMAAIPGLSVAKRRHSARKRRAEARTHRRDGAAALHARVLPAGGGRRVGGRRVVRCRRHPPRRLARAPSPYACALLRPYLLLSAARHVHDSSFVRKHRRIGSLLRVQRAPCNQARRRQMPALRAVQVVRRGRVRAADARARLPPAPQRGRHLGPDLRPRDAAVGGALQYHWYSQSGLPAGAASCLRSSDSFHQS
jgi:hypothetical protein